MGKQTGITDDQAERVLGYVLNGMPRTRACATVGVNKKTWERYRDRHPEYKARHDAIKSGSKAKRIQSAPNEKAVEVLILMENGENHYTKACKKVGISVTDFTHAVASNDLLSQRHKGVLEGMAALVMDNLMDLSTGAMPNIKAITYLLNNLSRYLPEDSPLPRFADRQEIKADVAARPHMIIHME